MNVKLRKLYLRDICCLNTHISLDCILENIMRNNWLIPFIIYSDHFCGKRTGKWSILIPTKWSDRWRNNGMRCWNLGRWGTSDMVHLSVSHFFSFFLFFFSLHNFQVYTSVLSSRICEHLNALYYTSLIVRKF